MTTPTKDLHLYGDDEFILRITMKATIDGDPIDLTGRTYLAQVRREPSSSEILATFNIDVGNLADGYIVLSLPDNAVRELKGVWDLQETLPGSSRPQTLIRGFVHWTEDVSR